jgi:hypothetical protein
MDRKVGKKNNNYHNIKLYDLNNFTRDIQILYLSLNELIFYTFFGLTNQLQIFSMEFSTYTESNI